MKLIHTLTIASAVLGLAGTSMAGSSAAAPASCSPDAFNPWNVELSLLHQRARGNDLNEQDFEDGVRLAVSYQSCPEAWGIRATYDEFKGTNLGTALFQNHGPEYHRLTLEGFKTGLNLGPLDCSYSAGLRYLSLDEPYDDGTTPYDMRSSGLGPVFGFDVSYALPYNFSLYGNSELAYYWPVFESKGWTPEPHDFTWSLGLGVRYDITFCPAIEGAYIKVGYEWDNFNRLTYSNTTQIAGWVIGVGYSF